MLAADVARSLPLEEVEIEHVAGRTLDVRVVPGAEPVVVGMLRSGLFLAEGMREALHDAALVLHRNDADLDEANLAGRVVAIVDAVINTGRSLRSVLAMIVAKRPRKIVVAALVGFRPTLDALAAEFPEIDFVVGRASERSYVGRGGTDTGARLFGTVAWESGAALRAVDLMPPSSEAKVA